jgi:hypothetical protein
MPEYTRERLIELALRELQPAAAQRQRCKDDIAFALERVAEQIAAGKAGSKANRKLLTRIVRTGKVFEQLRRRAKLPPDFPAGPPDLRPWLDSIGQYLDRERRPMRAKRAQYIQSHAASWAGSLLLRYGHEPSKTRRSRWDRLAAILASTPSKSLVNSLTVVRGRLFRRLDRSS